MPTRALGALLAAIAAAAFVVSIVSGAWWDGHPRVDGKVFTAKDVHIGLLGGTGCNTGGTGECQPLPLGQTFTTVAYGELGGLALTTAFAILVAGAAWRIADSRKRLAKLAMVIATLAAAGAIGLLVLGPQIKTSQTVVPPIGWGFMVFGGGIVAMFSACLATLRVEREPLRLKTGAKPMPAAAGAVAGAPAAFDVQALLPQPAPVLPQRAPTPLPRASAHPIAGLDAPPSSPPFAAPGAPPPSASSWGAPPSSPPFAAPGAPPPSASSWGAPRPATLSQPPPPSPPPPGAPRAGSPSKPPFGAPGAPASSPPFAAPRPGSPSAPPFAAPGSPSAPPFAAPGAPPFAAPGAPPSSPPFAVPPIAGPLSQPPASAPIASPGRPDSRVKPPTGAPPLPGLAPPRTKPTMPPAPFASPAIASSALGASRPSAPAIAGAPAIPAAPVLPGAPKAPSVGALADPLAATMPAPARVAPPPARAQKISVPPPRRDANPPTPTPSIITSATRPGEEPAPRKSQPTMTHTVPPMPQIDTPPPQLVRGTTQNDDSLETAMRETELITAVEIDHEAKAAYEEQKRREGLAAHEHSDVPGDDTDAIQTTARERVDADGLQDTVAAPPIQVDPDVPFKSLSAAKAATAKPAEKTPEKTAEKAAEKPSAPKVPISTAPASLPPPKSAAIPASGPTPACPQCEAPMAWVEEHLRFYCKSCRMYF